MREFIYGLDIETDTTVNGLDPSVAKIIAVGVSSQHEDRVFSGDEAQMLTDLDDWLAELPAGVLVTWNGSTFDLPFLSDRAAVCGVDLGLLLFADPSIGRRRDPIGEHTHAYRGSWHNHLHLDAYRLYRGDVGPILRVSCALKSIARLVGLPAVEVDAERMHELHPSEVAKYVTSDARLARQLVQRRWSSARRFADPRPYLGEVEPIVEPGTEPAPVWTGPTHVVAEPDEVVESVRVLPLRGPGEVAVG
jgi:DNA polymerase elongation subunit (family B)